MRTITIPHPEDVDAMLAEAFPQSLCRNAVYSKDGWRMFAILSNSNEDPTGYGATPEECLADLRSKIAAQDPVAKLRKQAEAAGYTLTPKQD